MQTKVGDVVAAIIMTVSGLIGLVLASRAEDDEMYLFGLSLAAFAAAFVFGLIKAHYDKAERLIVQANALVVENV